MELQETTTSIESASVENIEDQREEILKLTDELLLSAAEEFSMDPEDICRATCVLDSATSQSMAAFASTAEHIKEIIQETLKGRDLDPNNALSESNDPLCSLPGEDGIRQRIADLEKVIESNNQERFLSKEINSSESAGADPGSQSSNQISLDSACSDNITNGTLEPRSEDLFLPCVQQQEELSKNDQGQEVSTSKTKEECPLLTPNPSPEQQITNPQTTSSKSSVVTAAPASLLSEDKSATAFKANQKSKKGEKTAEQVLKSLGSAGSVEERLLTLCRRQAETLEELRGSESRHRAAERQLAHLNREKEQLQADHNRTVLAKSRLEGLCRELQRQNKAVKEESLLRIREEEEKRKEISGKFQGTLGDISSLLQDNKQRDTQLREENLQLAAKLKALVQHYDTWEKHMEKVVQQKELESQLSKARLGKALVQSQGEREQALIEKQRLLETMSAMQEKATQLAQSELQLRSELALYTNKYQEFQGVLAKSNQVFANFKGDMEKMSKKIKILEKETVQWKSKWENSNRSLVQMSTDKQKRDQELSGCQQRVATLEKLCRALQGERNALQEKLRAANCNEANCAKRDCCLPVVVAENPAG